MKNCHKILIEMHHAGQIPGNEWANLIATVDGLLGDWLAYTLGDEGFRPFINRCQATVDNLTALSAVLPVTWPGQRALIGAITHLQIADRAISKVFELKGPAYFEGQGGQSDPLPLRPHSQHLGLGVNAYQRRSVDFITHDGNRISADGRSAPL